MTAISLLRKVTYIINQEQFLIRVPLGKLTRNIINRFSWN